ncbi:heme exporter protein A [Aliiroseovarius crassostreae]|uniref:Cytochrome C biogenesis protein CcmA n=1 Tax=Aliiroseovarius crassostreae TaxID=154981 RepID=A0A0P7IVS6_9RHOB|nr:heme ABC exporter ATP-binding protein CcmA [Aliiroseovarius crassostreae]KPN63352.1 cytochrome C biogenesis protein CcmA [Aliiroseovarius crassostreae]SFU42190.1 heme exporter protein A [Aliiroseovarius crassostreae]
MTDLSRHTARLAAENLTVTRGGVPILQGVGFSLDPGEVLILRGPNGSGKTTLLRTLAGLQPPLHGEVLSGPETLTYGAHADGLKATLTVEENLRFWASVHGQEDISGAVEGFNLAGLLSRPSANLSAGQKRRLGLARLLVTGRPIWLLDEPTVSLDVPSVGLFADAVRAHQARGGAALIATHIDLGLDAASFDIGPYKADPTTAADLAHSDGFDDAGEGAFL